MMLMKIGTYCRYSGIFVKHTQQNDIIHSRFINIIAYTHCKAYHWEKYMYFNTNVVSYY